MDTTCIIRAWKDEQYRLGLSSKELALLPINPAGSIELTSDLQNSTVFDPPDISMGSLCCPDSNTCPSIGTCTYTCNTVNCN
ncbi:MAG TPA: mersacidin/lichenicidin family type 2 lantibiotic [Ktedonobacteraceae bacterium]|nr:mersacidin/lichenicidin family type 2 lantibiotic [Ktedonobacteraceae bacterium]